MDVDPFERQDPSLYARLEELYLTAPCNAYFAPRIEVRHAEARIEIDVRADLFHAAHAVHGSVYFKALDDAAFFAANSLEPQHFVLTGTFETKFLAPVSSGRLLAEGQVEEAHPRKIVASSVLFNEHDDDRVKVGEGRGVFVRSAIRLDGLGP